MKFVEYLGERFPNPLLASVEVIKLSETVFEIRTALVNDDALMQLQAPVGRVTGFDVVTPYFAREKRYMPTPERVIRAIEKTLDF